MSLKDRLLKVDKTSVMLEDSDIFAPQDFISTNIPILDIALSGEIGRGIHRGLTIFAGPSKHFKSLLGLISVKSYLDTYPDAMCMFYDSEYGTTPTYFKAVGVDTSRIIHGPIGKLENFRSNLANTLDEVKKGEHLILFVDSLGNIPSKKEVEDAMDEKDTTDMTRAKVMKSIMRIAMQDLNIKNLPMVAVGHTYDTMDKFKKKVVSGGTGIYYNANNIIIIGRRMNKKDGELLGNEFILNIDKSRLVKEGTKLPLTVTYEEGVHRYSGLLETALEGKYVIKPKSGWYSRPCVANDKSWREKQADTMKEFWEPIFQETDFKEFVKNKFQLQSVIFNEREENDNK